ncbi:hypothetical protein BSKO_06838 [Bryopsis sp. KO-2023]|nr:hypothetical protein BSKO_06838 [Bryopsis sp. KO-2023]
MSRLIFPLRLLALLATLHIGLCQSSCAGPGEDLRFFVLPLQEGVEAGFQEISPGQADSSLGALGFLDDEAILDLIRSSDAIFQVPLSTLSQFSSSTCNIPLSQACRLYPCGCGVGSGRRLLQCFPIFRCRPSTIGTAPGPGGVGRGPSSIPKFPNMLAGVCIGGTCTLFKIEPDSLENFQIPLDMTCPGITAGGAAPRIGLNSGASSVIGLPPPPRPVTPDQLNQLPPPLFVGSGQFFNQQAQMG